MILKKLECKDLTPERIGQIDLSEDGEITYKQLGETVVAERDEWHRPRWNDEKCKRLSEQWQAQVLRGDTVIGAFEGDLMVGVGIIRYDLRDHLAQLESLFVSKDYRRHGVAAVLTAEIERLARLGGATELYVSATPSVSAVGFYTSRGFKPTSEVIPELFELEPEDIHMRLGLGGRA